MMFSIKLNLPKQDLSLDEIFEFMVLIMDVDIIPMDVCVLQYKLLEEGIWHIKTDKQLPQLFKSKHPSPTLEIVTDKSTWMSIVNDKISGEDAFSLGKLVVNGDLQLLGLHEDLYNESKLEDMRAT